MFLPVREKRPIFLRNADADMVLEVENRYFVFSEDGSEIGRGVWTLDAVQFKDVRYREEPRRSRIISPNNITNTKMDEEKAWNRESHFIEEILRSKTVDMGRLVRN